MSAQETPWACRKCGSDDSLRINDKRVRSGFTLRCRPCHRLAAERWRKAHPQRASALRRKYYHADPAKARAARRERWASMPIEERRDANERWREARDERQEYAPAVSAVPREPSRALHSCAGSGRGLWSDGTPYVCAFSAWELDDDAPAVRA